MRHLVIALGILALAGSALADTVDYGWEDGVGTILGKFGNVGGAENIGPPDPVHTGSRALKVWEEPLGGTPQAYLAYIENLKDGEVVDASFWGFDETPGASPSLRIWAHYAKSGNVNSFEGSAGGNNEYTAGTGWSQLTWQWTFDSGGGQRDALVIEARLYSLEPGPPRQDFFIDDLSVTAPGTAKITVAPEPASLMLLLLGLGVGAVRR